MRSDVRIGIAIGLVIILGVVVYFVLSNNSNNANPPAADNTEKKEPAGGVHKIRRVADNKIAARNGGSTSAGQASVTPPADPYAKIDSAKTELAPVGPGPAVVESAKPDTSKTDLAAAVEKAKADLAKIESSKTDLAAVGPAKSDLAKTESVADLGGGASVRGASGVGAPAVDPIEERIRRRYDVEGTPSMGGGASADLRVTAPTVKPDAGFPEAGKGSVEVALVGSQKGAGLKAAGVGADSNLNKIEASKVESGYKAGPDPLLKSIDAADAGKPAVSDWVAKGQYEVQADDKEGAWGIARKVYKGNAKLHYLVIKANPGVDWNRLRPKQVLKILPPPDAAKTAVTPGAADPVAGNAAAPAAAVEEGKFTAPDEKGFRKYAVKKGDTGEKISKEAYGKAGHWGDIEKANPSVNAKRLSVKQVLVIPPLEKKAATTADSGLPGGVTGGTSGGVTGGVSGGLPGGATGGVTGGAGVEEGKFTAPDEKGFRKYVVKKGDTGEKISREAYGNGNHWGDIEKANPNVNAKRLSVKQVLVIPPVEKKAGDGASAAKDSGTPAGTVGQGGSGSAKQPKKKTTAKKTPAGKSGSGAGGETSGGTGSSSNGGGSTSGGSTGGSSGGARFD